MVSHAYNLNSWEAEAESLQVTGQHELHCEFQGRLGYRIRSCLKNK